MKVIDFVIKVDGHRRRYFQNVAQYELKNHKGSEMNDEDVQSARIYEISGKLSYEVYYPYEYNKHRFCCLRQC